MRSLGLSVALGKEAAKRKVKAFVELSTGMVYKADSSPSKEGDKIKPWSKIAVYKLQAEEELAKMEGYVQRRLAGPSWKLLFAISAFVSMSREADPTPFL